MANKTLKASILIGGSISSAFKSALASTESGLKKIGGAIEIVERKQKLLGNAIQTFARQGRNVDGMRERYARLTTQVDRLKRAQDRLNAATKRHATLTAVGGGMRTAGAVMTGAGVATLGAMAFATNEAKAYETEVARVRALGLGDDVTKQTKALAHDLKTFGTSQLENLTLIRDALSVFGDMHHAKMAAPILAKMKFANAAMYGAEHGAENESKFLDMLKVIELRGGTKSPAAFNAQANMIQKVISATGGRVGPEEWRHLISTGGLAAKSMRDDAFFYQLEPLVQEMGGDRVGTGLMTSYSSLYQGHTTKRAANNLAKLGLIADPSKVTHDKSGQIAHLDIGALKGADLFRQSQYEWMKKILLPTLAKKGLTSKDQVLDAIGSIFSGRKGGDIMAAMFLQQQQIEKNIRLNKGAADIDTLAKEGANTTAGKELNAKAKFENVKLRFGAAALPLYTSLLEKAAVALEHLNTFAEKHGTLTRAGVVAVVAIGGALVTLGPILAAAGIALNGYAALQMLAARRALAAATNIGIETEAIVAQGVAARTTGGLLSSMAAFAKRAMITLAIANAADYAAGKAGVGAHKADAKQDEANWQRMGAVRKVWSGGLRGIEHIGRAIGMTNISDQAQADRVAYETEALGGPQTATPATGAKPAAKPAGMPGFMLPRAKAPAAPVTNNTTNNNSFHIVQQPGESPEALARRVAALIDKQQGVATRGALTDRD